MVMAQMGRMARMDMYKNSTAVMGQTRTTLYSLPTTPTGPARAVIPSIPSVQTTMATKIRRTCGPHIGGEELS